MKLKKFSLFFESRAGLRYFKQLNKNFNAYSLKVKQTQKTIWQFSLNWIKIIFLSCPNNFVFPNVGDFDVLLLFKADGKVFVKSFYTGVWKVIFKV